MSLYRPLCSGRHLAAVLLACLFTSAATAESWTDLSGTRTIEAKMVGMWHNSVVLLMDDGRRVTVSLANLQAESRIQAQNLDREQKKFRTGVVGEIKGQAEEAAAPAPNPIPKPDKAPAYVQPKPNTPILEHLRWFVDQAEAGHIVGFFDALPPSYQQELSDLAKVGARKVNVASWQGLTGSIHQIGDVIVTRQRWFFSHPRFVAMGPDAVEPIEELVLLAAGFLRDSFDPKTLDLGRLQTMPLRDWIVELDGAMAPYLYEMNNFAVGATLNTFELVSEKGDEATVKSSFGTLVFTKVEGFWVPKEMSDGWAEGIANARTGIEAAPDGTLMSNPAFAMIPMMIQQKIGPLAGARDPKSCHTAMDDLFAEVQPMATTALASANIGGKRRGNSSGYGPGSGYEDDMDMEDMEDFGSGGDYEEEMRRQSQQPGGGGATSGNPRTDPNPNIGARLEEDMRKREQDLRNKQQPR